MARNLSKMTTTYSCITSKGQATIPADVQTFLNLCYGDIVRFSVQKKQIVIDKASPLDVGYLKALQGPLTEWNSDADNKAYNDL